MKKLVLVFLALLCFSLLSAGVSAGSVKIVAPSMHEVLSTASNPAFEIGVIGPGQKVELSIDRGTGEMSNDKTTFGQEAVWDRLEVVRSSLPAGWDSRDSLRYETPLTAFIIAAPDAAEGQYEVEVQAVDEYEGVATIKFKVLVTVSQNVLDVQLDPSTIVTGVGHPAIYSFKLSSKSDASDAYQISTAGLPYAWAFTKTIFIPRKSERTIQYEVVGSSQKQLDFKFQVRSLSSSLITVEKDARLVTTTSLWQDMKAAALGVPVFPNAEQPIYSLIGFVSNLFK